MASRTQLRLPQITGSYGTTAGLINDQTAAAATGSQNNSSFLDVTSHLASAIKRLHGHDSFSENLAGVFNQNIVITGSLTLKNSSDDNDRFSVSSDGATVNIGLADSATDKKLVFNHDTAQTVVGIDDSLDSDVGRFVIHTSDDDGLLNGTADFSIDADGDVAIANSLTVTSNVTVNNDLSVTGNATVAGNLTVTGDIDYQYVTSSIVEFNDPMLVTNAFDLTNNNAFPSSSFASEPSQVESSAAVFDYGVVSKRSAAYDQTNGIGTGDTSFPSLRAYNDNDAAENISNTTLAGGFGIFHVTASVNAGEVDVNHANPFNIQRGDIAKLRLSSHRGIGVRESDILDMHRGAFFLLSSSNGDGRQMIGMIRSGSSHASNNVVEVQMLGNTEKYNNLTSKDPQIQHLDFRPSEASPNSRVTLTLLNAYAGSIFDKESNIMHIAAAAVTGSDNQFISGSANILLHGGVQAARYNLNLNDPMSGSKEVATFNAVFGASDDNPEVALMTQAFNGSDSVDLAIKASHANAGNLLFLNNDHATAADVRKVFLFTHNADITIGTNKQENKVANNLILSASQAGRIKLKTGTGAALSFPAADGSSDHVIKTNGSGDLSFVDPNTLINSTAAKATFKVKSGVTIAAGANNLILTGATSTESTLFEQLHTGLNGNILGETNFTNAEDGALDDRLDVYVNGQLLTSASKPTATQALGGTDGDYHIVKRTSTVLSGTFAFDLEADDIISLVFK